VLGEGLGAEESTSHPKIILRHRQRGHFIENIQWPEEPGELSKQGEKREMDPNPCFDYLKGDGMVSQKKER